MIRYTKPFLLLTIAFMLMAQEASSKPYVFDKEMQSGNTLWKAAFDLLNEPEQVVLVVRVSLLSSQNVKKIKVKEAASNWEREIEKRWNGLFKAQIDGLTKNLVFDVKFTHHQPHHKVLLRSGNWRPNSHNWYLDMPSSVAAHEFGHLLGAYDEYSGGALDPNSMLIDGSSLMGANTSKGTLFIRHLSIVKEAIMEALDSNDVELLRVVDR
jgi:hypothetical protein